MPNVTNRGVDLYYETQGHGGTVVFVPDLGCGAWLWGWQAPALTGQYETITWDLRGCGRSGVAETYSIPALASDLEAVLAADDVSNATVVGAGMGGMIALQYALEYTRSTRLILLATTASGHQFETNGFLGAVDDLDSLTSADFRESHGDAVEQIVAWRRAADGTEDVRRAHAEAIDSFDSTDRLYEITHPTFVCHGEADQVVAPVAGKSLAEELPRGTFEAFEDGSHFFFIEQARLVTDAIAAFLDSDP